MTVRTARRHFLRRILLASTLCAAVFATPAGAQSRPDFSGEWIRPADSAAAVRTSAAPSGDAAFQRGEMGSGWGTVLSVKQEAARLTLEYPYFSAYDLQPPIHLEYALDGSESRNSIMLGHAASELRSRVAWEGSSMVITTHAPGPVGPDGRPVTVETRHALTLQSPTLLRIVTTRVGVLGGATTTAQVTYRKR